MPALPYTSYCNYLTLLPRYELVDKTDIDIVVHAIRCVKERDLRIIDCGAGPGRYWDLLGSDVRHIIAIEPNRALWRPRHSDLWTYIEADGFSYLRTHTVATDVVTWIWSLNYELLSFFEDYDSKLNRVILKDWNLSFIHASNILNQVLDALANVYLVILFFDANTEEQTFVTEIWETVAPFPFHDRNFTRLLWEDIARRNARRLNRTYRSTHLSGRALYGPLETALHRMLNFHLRGHFNSDRAIVAQARQFLAGYLDHHLQVSIPSGAYLYEIGPQRFRYD